MRAILFPGQGAQFKGMGKDLFAYYPDVVYTASNVLGYDLAELCIHDPEKKLSQTQYTQPALYTVNALTWFEEELTSSHNVDFCLGHSLGEYNALLAAGAFDFETGLRLVKKRGEVMGAASNGGMIVVMGLQAQELENFLREQQIEGIDLANYNTHTQIVIAGQPDVIRQADIAFRKHGINAAVLQVSAPFHSRYMLPAQVTYAKFIQQFTFSHLKYAVIANTTARPYDEGRVAEILSNQITHAVLWHDSIRYLLEHDPAMEFQEIGNTILSKMVKRIKEQDTVPVRSAPTLNHQLLTRDKDVPSAKRQELILKTESIQEKPSGNGKQKKIFCLSYAGGDYRSFMGMNDHLERVHLVPLEYPGRGRRMLEPLQSDIEALVDDLYAQICHQLDEPYAIYGHSLGARLAFLLCRRIRQHQHPLPEHLFVSGDSGPSLDSKEKSTWELSTPLFWEHLKEIGGCPSEFFQIPQLMAFFEPILRSDFRALSSFEYRQEPPLDVPITVLLGDHENVKPTEAKLWQRETIHPTTIFVFSGDHFFFRHHWVAISELVEDSFTATSYSLSLATK